MLFLIFYKDVQDELKLGAAHRDRLHGIMQGVNRKKHDLAFNDRGEGFDKARERMREVDQAAGREVLAFLTTELNAAQIKRLGQFSIQMKGAEGLLESIRSRSLDLSDGQRTSLNQIVSQRSPLIWFGPPDRLPSRWIFKWMSLTQEHRNSIPLCQCWIRNRSGLGSRLRVRLLQSHHRPHAPLKRARAPRRRMPPLSPLERHPRKKGKERGQRERGEIRGHNE